MEYDVEVNGGMGFYQFRILTDAGREFVSAQVHLEDYQNPDAFGVDDTRMAEAITVGMLNEGLNVLYNGQPATLKGDEIYVPA